MDERPTERVDERDTMFARAARREGTAAFEDTYARRPELRADDDRIRAMPPLLSPEGRAWDEALFAEAADYFERIEAFEADPDRVAALAGVVGDEAALRRAAFELGAVAVGATDVDERLVYSHKGRLDEDYGRPLEADLPRALVVLVEMEHGAMRGAPGASTIRESARQYWRSAVIARTLAAALRRAGFRARAQYDAHYEVLLVPLAVAAGLGELGRHNLLVADRYGSRVRIAAVLTDAPLTPDRPVDLGVRHFCSVCRKCAESCPPRALSTGEPEVVRGVRKWPTRVEACYRWWRTLGTDCGICMAHCPFSHENTALHNAVRAVIKRFPSTHRAAVLLDDLLYGRSWRGGPPGT